MSQEGILSLFIKQTEHSLRLAEGCSACASESETIWNSPFSKWGRGDFLNSVVNHIVILLFCKIF